MALISVSIHPAAREGRPQVVAVTGELDVSGLARVRRALADVEGRWAGSPIALDLREVVHLDSSALRLLLDCHSRARRQGRRFVVVAGDDGAVGRLLTLTMLADHVEVVGDLASI